MKKILTFFIALLVCGLLLMSYNVGYNAGIHHAVMTAEMFVVDLPDRNESGGFDEDEISVYMIIDGEIHEYGCDIC